MAIARTLVQHESNVLPATATLRVGIRKFDPEDGSDIAAGIQEFVSVDVAVQPGSLLEAALLDFQTKLIARLNVLYPGKNITRPAA